MTAIPVDVRPFPQRADMAMPDLWVGADVRVPVADGRRLRYADLDQAATTPAFRSVRDTVDHFLDWSASVHRGAGFKSRLSTDVYEQAREVVGSFVGADAGHDRVVFTRSATESLNIAPACSTGNPVTWWLSRRSSITRTCCPGSASRGWPGSRWTTMVVRALTHSRPSCAGRPGGCAWWCSAAPRMSRVTGHPSTMPRSSPHAARRAHHRRRRAARRAPAHRHAARR